MNTIGICLFADPKPGFICYVVICTLFRDPLEVFLKWNVWYALKIHTRCEPSVKIIPKPRHGDAGYIKYSNNIGIDAENSGNRVLSADGFGG